MYFLRVHELDLKKSFTFLLIRDRIISCRIPHHQLPGKAFRWSTYEGNTLKLCVLHDIKTFASDKNMYGLQPPFIWGFIYTWSDDGMRDVQGVQTLTGLLPGYALSRSPVILIWNISARGLRSGWSTSNRWETLFDIKCVSFSGRTYRYEKARKVHAKFTLTQFSEIRTSRIRPRSPVIKPPPTTFFTDPSSSLSKIPRFSP